MAIRLGPAFLSVDDLVEPARPLSPLRVRWRERQAIAYEDRTEGPLGIIPSQNQGPEAACREADRDRLLDFHRLQYRQRVGDELFVRICRRVSRSIR